jgi:hypothetical protein
MSGMAWLKIVWPADHIGETVEVFPGMLREATAHAARIIAQFGTGHV